MRNGRSRRVQGLDGCLPGDHICWTYADDDEMIASLAAYVSEGSAAGQRVACYLPTDRFDDLLGSLTSRVPGLDEAIARGSAIFGTSREAYLPTGVLDPDARLESYADMAYGAVEDGYSGLRVLGDATEILEASGQNGAWAGYEIRADIMIARLPLIAVCSYDARRASDKAMALLRSVHAASTSSDGDDADGFHLHATPAGSLILAGEVDFVTADGFEVVSMQAARDVCDPVFDLSGLTFVDAAGMRAIVEGLRAVGDTHGRVVVTGAGPIFRRVWELLSCDAQVAVQFEPAPAGGERARA